MGDERAGRVENRDDTVLSRSLRLDEIAERVELEIGGKDAGHLASQGCANLDHRCADTKRKIRQGDKQPVGFHRLLIPGPLAGVVSIFP